MNERLKYLFVRYFDQTINDEERSELFALIEQTGNKVSVMEMIDWTWNRFDGTGPNVISQQRLDAIFNGIVGGPPTLTNKPPQRVHLLKTAWFKYAAAVILLIASATTYFFIHTSGSKTEVANKRSSAPIEPGTDRAILTLSDGRQIVLDDSTNEQITDGSISINKGKGILTYNAALTSENSTLSYNTMHTPRGGQYRLALPDGSQVWLNSASSLKYPTSFTGDNRIVELTGEGYFEIKENKEKPFIVRTKKLDVSVLGTAFNVNAYDDEPVLATTLVEGAVKLSSQSGSLILKPEQQGTFNHSDGKLLTTKPDLEQVLAWKNGTFQFVNADIRSVMRQVARWYDVTIEYKGPLPEAEFNGYLSRTENAEMLLEALSLTNKVHFIVSGKKITVVAGKTPKQ